MGYPPFECQDIDEIIQSCVAFMHNIIIVTNDPNRDSSNITYMINSYVSDIKKKIQFYEYERNKVN